jgi:capsular polysaccharide biosynthesis protein
MDHAGAALEKRKAKEIDIKEIVGILKRRIWIILVAAFLAGIAGALYHQSTTTNIYQSSTRLLVEANPNQMSTLVVMLKDPVVMEKVVKELNLQISPEGLASLISANNIGDSQVVLLSVINQDPELAAQIANNTAKVYKAEIAKILRFTGIKLLKEAKVNPYPINNSGFKFTFISMVIGIVLGVGLVFFLNSLDETIKKEQEIENMFGLPVIGHISKIKKKNLKTEYPVVEEAKVRSETVGIQ